MSKLTTIQDIQLSMAEGSPIGKVDEPAVRRLWWAALETLQEDILASVDLSGGLWLAAPLPALYETNLLEKMQGWVWAPDQLENLFSPHAGLLPPSRIRTIHEKSFTASGGYTRLPLRKEDGHDPLLIIITQELQVALTLFGQKGERSLLVRSDPKSFSKLLKLLDSRLNHENQEQAFALRNALTNLGQLNTNDSFNDTFWPLLSERLAGMAPSLTLLTKQEDGIRSKELGKEDNSEVALLEALTHEVRTPLSTIRTLIRSLLRRSDLSELVIDRLRQIDVECTEQIDRFGLIFNAAELERKKPCTSFLASTNLGNMLESLEPSWSQQLERRGITLEMFITPDLPEVLSDPERLELMLGGLIDRSSRGLQAGETLFLELVPAGPRLKLQILSQLSAEKERKLIRREVGSDLGTVLSWNPNTGSLQLSQAATQRLLASLGGRLARRRDSALTVFFPISEGKS